MSKTRILIAGVLGLCLLAGCQRTYSLHMRNLTEQPITAKILVGEGYLKAETFIGPGDRARVGDVTVPAGMRIWAEADSKANPGEPARRDLVPGKNVLNVEQRDEEGRLRIVEAD